MVDHAHVVFRESASEPREGGMIGSGIIKRKPQKFFEGDFVVDLGFQFRVGINLKPLPKKQAFHQKKRWIGIVTPSGIIIQKQAFDFGPVDRGVDLSHSFDRPVFSHGSKERLFLWFNLFRALTTATGSFQNIILYFPRMKQSNLINARGKSSIINFCFKKDEK